MLTAIFIIIGLILLVFVHELGHFLAAKQAGIKVEEFGFGFPPRIWGFRKGETLYSVNWLPLGGFVRIYGENKERLEDRARERGEQVETSRTFYAQSLRKRFTVVAAGISINFIAGWLLLSSILMIGSPFAVVITTVEQGSPAAQVGAVDGDTVVGFNSADEFIAFTHANAGKSVPLTLKGSGGERVVEAKLRTIDSGAPFGAAITTTGLARHGFFDALYTGLIHAVQATGQIFAAFGRLIGDLFTTAHIPENIVGPVGIFKTAGQIGQLGIVYVIQLIAMISLNLAALNAIPFPALDGGKILLMLVERIKGSPIKPTIEAWATIGSFVFLVLLMLVITGRDIIRLF